ncbi:MULTISPECIES: Rpn family recombination-promoting nuclease/putative transposase [Lactobacillus]|uniref:Rpn family recombination-promoting nuclease/putative transposase n=1 Tax=Lactobacillus TaxID=1578 RepID=UPI000B5D9AE9|nr:MULTISPECIES: Rpn family recombination-promoting nuclease/putative transposase [Lactobacillus]OXC13139.1 hypothetical protein AYP78_01385 [Lactobacillus crispatus]OXC17716.1 hypothetical protein AYP80_09985 [Lactobacillus crispatus]OXC18242.1 hypothetical protein AYP79_05715 [Lactobacillus crispatus]OXC45805.1 hypothetical protein AYP94_03860 [Lactobacillus crispatus]OXC46426.1 hypothetical protein AYP95_00200 [Lactobacillus crispatus]
MKNTHNNRQWFGFSEDKVFGEIMSNPAFCRHVLQGILPEIPIKKIFPPKKQEVIIDPEHRDQKDVRLDIFVEDINGNLYNIEMQRSDDDDIARRMRYYASKNDQRYTLHQGYTYNDLKNVFIIFLCTFKTKQKVAIKSTYQTINVDNHADILQDGLTKIIINSNGVPDGTETETLLNLVKLMKDLPVHGDKLFDKAQKRIESMNADPEWRDTIMDFETRMLEREQVGEKKGRMEGEKKGRKEGEKKGLQQGLKTGALTLVASLKDVGCTSQQILQQLKQKYGNVFSDKQLEEFLKQS